jgi:hypothetical protein
MYKNLKINVGQIYEGWKNKLLPDADMKEQIDLVSAERIAICEGCANHSNNHSSKRPDAHCVSCGCTLSAKTKFLSCKCPIDKWSAVLNDEQQDIIEDRKL